MTTLAKPLRAALAEHYSVERPEVAEAQQSIDGTRKWLLRFPDRQEVETVHIPEDGPRHAVRLVAGRLHADLPLLPHRHAAPGAQSRPGEIVGQVMLARDALGEWPSPADGRLITNIVMMGMGEPLYNYDNVAKALQIVMDQEGIALSRAQDHAVDLRRGADDPPLRRGDRRATSRSRCTP